jgi:hypothetical protein
MNSAAWFSVLPDHRCNDHRKGRHPQKVNPTSLIPGDVKDGDQRLIGGKQPEGCREGTVALTSAV